MLERESEISQVEKDTVYLGKAERELLTPMELNSENMYLAHKGTRASLCLKSYQEDEIFGFNSGKESFLQKDVFVVPVKEDIQKKEKDKSRFCFVMSFEGDLEKCTLHRDRWSGGTVTEKTPYLYLKKADLEKFNKQKEEKLPENIKKQLGVLKNTWDERQQTIFDS